VNTPNSFTRSLWRDLGRSVNRKFLKESFFFEYSKGHNTTQHNTTQHNTHTPQRWDLDESLQNHVHAVGVFEVVQSDETRDKVLFHLTHARNTLARLAIQGKHLLSSEARCENGLDVVQ
jgi:hypothetical protein